MKLTDKEAIKALRKARVLELEEMLDAYPTKEVDGRTDWEMIANEAGWLLDSCNSCDCVRYEDLAEAREIISRSRRGLPNHIGKPYKEWEVRNAKDRVNEYNRLTRFVTKLKGVGLYCPYC